jgi:hypothetical protein
MDNGVEPTLLPDVRNNPTVNDPDFLRIPRKRVRQKGTGGLHFNYR